MKGQELPGAQRLLHEYGERCECFSQLCCGGSSGRGCRSGLRTAPGPALGQGTATARHPGPPCFFRFASRAPRLSLGQPGFKDKRSVKMAQRLGQKGCLAATAIRKPWWWCPGTQRDVTSRQLCCESSVTDNG